MIKKIDRYLTRQIVCMMLSMLIAEIIAWIYPVDQSFWIPLTTFCVCLYIDTPLTALRRTVHRILGSLYGVVVAGLICLFVTSDAGFMNFLVIFAGLTLWSRAFVQLYYLFVACITAATIMLLAILMRHTAMTPDYLITERIIFTVLGAMISLLISLIVMPVSERPDMLKTYRHYLTRFYLEYRMCIWSMQYGAAADSRKVDSRVNDILESSRIYQEKLPVWRYALFFDRFIFRAFTRFLHRIHKMRILNLVLLSSIRELPRDITLSEEIRSRLNQNRVLTKRILLSLMRLDKNRAEQYLNTLHIVNDNLEKGLREYGCYTTIIISIRDLEQDLVHLKSGTVQMYLTYKREQQQEN